jgi:hypothetical protein
VSVGVGVGAGVGVCMCMRVYVYVCVCVCVCVSVCVCMYIHIGAWAKRTAKESYSTAKESHSTAKETHSLFRSPRRNEHYAHTYYAQEDKENVPNFGERVRGRKSHAGSRSSAHQQCSLAKVCVWGGGVGGFKCVG